MGGLLFSLGKQLELILDVKLLFEVLDLLLVVASLGFEVGQVILPLLANLL